MFTKIFISFTIACLANLAGSPVLAIELDEATRTIPVTSDVKQQS